MANSSIINVLKKVPALTKKISGKPLETASKVVGAGVIVSSIYDAHVNGAERADIFDSINTANKMHNDYKQYISLDKESATLAKLKRYWYDIKQNTIDFHFMNKTRGYLGSFSSTILSNTLNILLAVAAIKMKKAGKIAGTILTLHAAKTVLFDVLELGRKKEKL